MQTKKDDNKDDTPRCVRHDFILNGTSGKETAQTSFCLFCGLASIRSSDDTVSESFVRSEEYNIRYALMDNHFQIVAAWVERHAADQPTLSKINLPPHVKQPLLASLHKTSKLVGWNRSIVLKAMVIFDVVMAEDLELRNYIEEALNLSLIMASKVDRYSSQPIKTSEFLCIKYEEELSQMDPYHKENNLRSMTGDYLSIELRMADALSWNFDPVTPNDFVQLFLQKGVMTESELAEQMPQILHFHRSKGSLPEVFFPNAKRLFASLAAREGPLEACLATQAKVTVLQLLFADSLTTVINELLFNVLLFDQFYDYEPFMVALAIIATARKAVGLSGWSEQLCFISKTRLEDFGSLVEVLQRVTVDSRSHQTYYDGVVRKAFASLDDCLAALETEVSVLADRETAAIFFDSTAPRTSEKHKRTAVQGPTTAQDPTESSPVFQTQLTPSATQIRGASQLQTEHQNPIHQFKEECIDTATPNPTENVRFFENTKPYPAKMTRCCSFLSSRESVREFVAEGNDFDQMLDGVQIKDFEVGTNPPVLQVTAQGTKTRRRSSLTVADVPLKQEGSRIRRKVAERAIPLRKEQLAPAPKTTKANKRQPGPKATDSGFSISKNSTKCKNATLKKIRKQKPAIVLKK